MTKAERIIMVCTECENGNMSSLAKKTGVTPAYISKLKNHPESEPSDIFIREVSRRYNVSEEWLRTGEGDMYGPVTKNQRLIEFVNRVMADQDESFRKRYICALENVPDEGWAILEKFLDDLFQSDER